MNSILRNPTHVAQIGYNGFNMEQIVDFTSAPCMLLPIYYDYLNPGDKVKCNAFVKLRTNPMVAPAEFSAEIQLDWFAVPLEQLYKFFGDMYYNVDDIQTSLLGEGLNSFYYYPYIENVSFYNDFVSAYAELISEFEFPIAYSSSNPIVILNDRLRLLDCLGVPVATWLPFANNVPNLPIAAWLFSAYQKIYMDFYRLSDREAPDRFAYNLDQFYGSGYKITGDFRQRLTTLRYCPWLKDERTNVFVSPLQGSGDIGSLGMDAALFNSWLSSNVFETGSSPAASGIDFTFNKPTSVYAVQSEDTQSPSSYLQAGVFNAANIHALFAMEKALEITRRSGKHYDAQTLAHWGVKVPNGISGEVIYLGRQSQPFIVGDVVSTSGTENDPLGTLAGKGYSDARLSGSENKPITFEANSHCVLMCVYHVQPDLRYTQVGFDKLLTFVDPADFVHPEFDNLGMQPLFNYQVNYDLPAADAMKIYGWQYSYSELKIKRNRVFGDVSAHGSLNSWIPQFDASEVGINDNSLDAFMGRPDWLNDSMYTYYMYQNIMNSNGEPDNTSYAKLYNRDPFINSVSFQVVKSSKMSKYGLTNI